MERVLLIAAGAALGANARYWLGIWTLKHLGQRFPYGTLFVNVTGSFLLGFLLAFATQRTLPPAWRFFLIIGFCGSYTTFSSYSAESIHLLQGDLPWLGWLNMLSNNLLSLLAVLAGFGLARLLN